MRIQRVKKDYKENEKNYKAEGKRLCDLQHEEYIKFYDVFNRRTPKTEYHPHDGALQRDDKGKTYYFHSGKDYVMCEPTIEQLYCLLTQLYRSNGVKITHKLEISRQVHILILIRTFGRAFRR